MTTIQALPAMDEPSTAPRGRRPVMVLIQVPKARLHHGQAHRLDRALAGPVISPGSRGSRRRLKREFRIGGRILLAILILSLAVEAGRPRRLFTATYGADPGTAIRLGERPVAVLPRNEFEPRVVATEAREFPAAVLLSIEPASTNGEHEPQSPVVFPGYLLPDDTLEEQAHEGS